jgi:hypothetical protein
VPEVPDAPEDATAMKPVTVISASGPRRIAAQDPAPAPDAEDEETSGVSALVWAGIGAAVLAVLVGFLALRGDGRPEDPGVVVPTESQTPTDVVPDVLTQAPTLTGRRTASGVVFEWQSPVPVEPGDSFSYHRDDTDEYGTTTRQQLLIRTDDPVCLDLRMTRGADNSPSASQCVS